MSLSLNLSLIAPNLKKRVNKICSLFLRMPPPQLPTYQDCHELWSKKRRRQMREQLQAEGNSSTAPHGTSQVPGSPHPHSGPVSKSGSVVSLPSSDKLEENSSQGWVTLKRCDETQFVQLQRHSSKLILPLCLVPWLHQFVCSFFKVTHREVWN